MLVTTRKAAFGVHLLISLILLIILLTVIFFIWYPYDLIFAGGIDGLKILMGVDLVVGPLLTYIVFKPGKKGLKFDLSLIAGLQVICLAYGMWMVHSQRPLVQVLIDDGIHLLSISDIQQQDMDTSKLVGRSPSNVVMNLPEDENSWSAIKFSTEFADNKPFSFRSDLYIPISEVTKEQYNNRLEAVIRRYGNSEMEELNTAEKSCTWIPIISVHVNGYACHSYENGIEKLSDRKFF